MPNDRTGRRGLSRRQFLTGVGAAGAGTALAREAMVRNGDGGDAPLRSTAGETLQGEPVAITLQVNGRAVAIRVEPRTTLLNALRNHAEPPITGPKLVCDQGACGGCTVLVDGRTAYSCMLLAVDAVGRKITTVEGLAPEGALSPVQEAFVEKDALMCGFCTPGFVTSVHALLQSNPNPTLEDVKRACSGNFCRCGTYPRIFEAALDAARKMKGA